MKILKVALWGCLLYFMLTIVVSFSSFYQHEPLEKNFYSYFAHSLIEDGDLNIVNQVPKEERWLVTKNYQHPTHLDHGLVTILVPAFLYVKICQFFGFNYFKLPYSQYDFAFILLNLFALTASLIIFWHFLKREGENNKEIILKLILFTLSTPLFFYSFFCPINSDLLAMLVLTLLGGALFFFQRINQHNFFSYFSLGTFFGLSLAFKTSHTFALIIFIPLIYSLYKESLSPLKVFNCLIALFLGFGLIYLCLLTNNFLQIGQIGNLYSHLFNIHFFSLKEVLFYPNGYFVTSPMYFVIIFASILFYSRLTLTKRFYLLALIIFIIVTSFRIPGNDSLLGAKILIPFSLLFILLIPFLTNLKYRLLWRTFFVLLVFYNLFVTYQYMQPHPQAGWATYYFTSDFSFLKWGKQIINAFFSSIAHWKDGEKVLRPFFPLSLLLGFLLALLSNFPAHTKKHKEKIILISLLSLPLIYFFVTFSNLYNATKVTHRLQAENFYSKSVVANGAELYLYDEIMDIVPKSIVIQKKYGSENDVKKRVIYLAKYLQVIQSQIIQDPLNFKDELRNNTYRPSGWKLHPYQWPAKGVYP